MTHSDHCYVTNRSNLQFTVHFLHALTDLNLVLIPLSSMADSLMGTVRLFDWLVSRILKLTPDIDDGFEELFQEKYLFCKNKSNVYL